MACGRERNRENAVKRRERGDWATRVDRAPGADCTGWARWRPWCLGARPPSLPRRAACVVRAWFVRCAGHVVGVWGGVVRPLRRIAHSAGLRVRGGPRGASRSLVPDAIHQILYDSSRLRRTGTVAVARSRKTTGAPATFAAGSVPTEQGADAGRTRRASACVGARGSKQPTV